MMTSRGMLCISVAFLLALSRLVSARAAAPLVVCPGSSVAPRMSARVRGRQCAGAGRGARGRGRGALSAPPSCLFIIPRPTPPLVVRASAPRRCWRASHACSCGGRPVTVPYNSADSGAGVHPDARDPSRRKLGQWPSRARRRSSSRTMGRVHSLGAVVPLDDGVPGRGGAGLAGWGSRCR